MKDIHSYIYSKPPEQAAILEQLHRMISQHPKIQGKISYSLPCYKIKNPVCHLNSMKDGTVEIVFWRARELSNESGALDFKDRKRMAGITYGSVDEIDESLLHPILQEAYLLDETVEHKPMKLG
ncbi:hypothetical protein BFP72_16705 [Reichenbachiella sp. 5M10]|uniref:DUF1801 domain-containing protein n=1 Tax=Reichenbachiella sp. 5M10 TaxID=1889772 RepID=UPI000C15AC5D|nr:DUF1801 domain-containing protein [Reichenbachiella sp. 5M10]PIB36926.1 hypothetical protein BFP72_16705 [Reichenbachiella sp. 5M10]